MSNSAKARRAQREIYKSKIVKLQKAGLIGDIDLRKKATPAIKRKLEKYAGFLIGKESVVKAKTAKDARELRRKFGLKGDGKSIVIPREKGERLKIDAKGQITSIRPNPANPKEKIKKTIGEKLGAVKRGEGNVYYTLPTRKRGLGTLKRKTFANFDELLFYLKAYDIDLTDVEDYIEIEEVSPVSERAKTLDATIKRDKQTYYKRRGKKLQKEYRAKRKAARKK